VAINDEDQDDTAGSTQSDNASDSQAPTGQDKNTASDKVDPGEEALVKKRWKEYETGRKFDENHRKQIARDRKYASGTHDLRWAVSTNNIGAFIDILTSLLYARDPDVSVKKAAQVVEDNTLPMEDFAKTLEIVISKLWKGASLRRKCRKVVRSVLSVSEGWIKATMVAEKEPQPEMETAMNDHVETLARLDAQRKILEDSNGDPTEVDAQREETEALIDELHDKVELKVKRAMAIDFVKAESIQVSLDVENIEDYLDANWIGNEIFVEKDDALERFKRLTVEDIKSATLYYQRTPKELNKGEDDSVSSASEQMTAESAEMYTASSSDADACPFLRVIEQWDRRDKQIRTMIAGVNKWAVEPYSPPYPTARFYPYFYTAFFETDGARHPQSLSWRLFKLQDEFSCTRSNFRLSRERAIPATLFNATMLDAEEAKKLKEAALQEYVPLRPNDPATPMANLFAAKPVSPIDPRLYDTSPIMSDMERISGVQEALQSAIQRGGTPKTATEANIEQSGTSARTTADRDQLEWMLIDLAIYTAEQALQCLPIKFVQRMAGPNAFWPGPNHEKGTPGMDVEDLFTLVEVTIEAGSTGKPKQQTDQAAWSVVLPLIEKIIGNIITAYATGNIPLAKALEELVKETMLRMGDTTDVERFLPTQAPPGSPGSGAPPRAPPADVKVQLKGVLDPATSAALVAPTVKMDQTTLAALNQPPPGAPGGPGGPPPGALSTAPSGQAAPQGLPPPGGEQPGPGGATMPPPH